MTYMVDQVKHKDHEGIKQDPDGAALHLLAARILAHFQRKKEQRQEYKHVDELREGAGLGCVDMHLYQLRVLFQLRESVQEVCDGNVGACDNEPPNAQAQHGGGHPVHQ